MKRVCATMVDRPIADATQPVPDPVQRAQRPPSRGLFDSDWCGPHRLVKRVAGRGLEKQYMSRRKHGPCALCKRDTVLTFHHLIPRKVHRRARYRKTYSRETLQRGIELCRRCHTGLHHLYDEMTLAQRLNTLESLQQDEAVQRHVLWVARQKS